MQPQEFTKRCLIASRTESWNLRFIGSTEVGEDTAAAGGLRVAVLQRGRETRIMAADTAPESNVFSDHIVRSVGVRTGVRLHEPGTEYVDAIPLTLFERFQGATAQQVREVHTRIRNNFGDMVISQMRECGFDPDAIAVVRNAPDSMQVRDGPDIFFHVVQHPMKAR